MRQINFTVLFFYIIVALLSVNAVVHYGRGVSISLCRCVKLVLEWIATLFVCRKGAPHNKKIQDAKPKAEGIQRKHPIEDHPRPQCHVEETKREHLALKQGAPAPLQEAKEGEDNKTEARSPTAQGPHDAVSDAFLSVRVDFSEEERAGVGRTMHTTTVAPSGGDEEVMVSRKSQKKLILKEKRATKKEEMKRKKKEEMEREHASKVAETLEEPRKDHHGASPTMTHTLSQHGSSSSSASHGGQTSSPLTRGATLPSTSATATDTHGTLTRPRSSEKVNRQQEAFIKAVQKAFPQWEEEFGKESSLSSSQAFPSPAVSSVVKGDHRVRSIVELYPKKFERHGHVVVITQFGEGVVPERHFTSLIAKCFAASFSPPHHPTTLPQNRKPQQTIIEEGRQMDSTSATTTPLVASSHPPPEVVHVSEESTVTHTGGDPNLSSSSPSTSSPIAAPPPPSAGEEKRMMVDVVLYDPVGITGELRQPCLKLLYQDPHQAYTFSRIEAPRILEKRWKEAVILTKRCTTASVVREEEEGLNAGEEEDEELAFVLSAPPSEIAVGDRARLTPQEQLPVTPVPWKSLCSKDETSSSVSSSLPLSGPLLSHGRRLVGHRSEKRREREAEEGKCPCKEDESVAEGEGSSIWWMEDGTHPSPLPLRTPAMCISQSYFSPSRHTTEDGGSLLPFINSEREAVKEGQRSAASSLSFSSVSSSIPLRCLSPREWAIRVQLEREKQEGKISTETERGGAPEDSVVDEESSSGTQGEEKSSMLPSSRLPSASASSSCLHNPKDLCAPSSDILRRLVQHYVSASPTFTVHVENGVGYGMDVQRVMFSSGNTTERMHFSNVNAEGEEVIDMFCGIGYFTLPLAMYGKPLVIHAIDKNPDSVAFLRLNAIWNRVGHVIDPRCGDNREVGDEWIGKCDRVLMGYLPSCKEHLPRAVMFLKRSPRTSRTRHGTCHLTEEAAEGCPSFASLQRHTSANGRTCTCVSSPPLFSRPMGILHYHFLADASLDPSETVLEHLRDELGEEILQDSEEEYKDEAVEGNDETENNQHHTLSTPPGHSVSNTSSPSVMTPPLGSSNPRRSEEKEERRKRVTLLALRRVKSYAPKVYHYVADVQFS